MANQMSDTAVAKAEKVIRAMEELTRSQLWPTFYLEVNGMIERIKREIKKQQQVTKNDGGKDG